MDKRKAIGLVFSYNENWIGGSYYIINIIKTLNFLPKETKPKIVLLSFKESDFEIIKAIQYPFIEYQIIKENNLPNWKSFLNKVGYKLAKKTIFLPNQFKKIDFLFPVNFNPVFKKVKNKAFWIPDFQERYLPHFFQEKEIQGRKELQDLIAAEKNIIFSSDNALQDYIQFYPNSKINKYVFNFTSILPNIENCAIEEIFEKYKLEKQNYFFSPNQFWAHKNHIVILKALKKIKEEGALDFKVYFSGKEHDHRSPNYFQDLLVYVKENQLENDVRFLGFIDREDQLSLMNNALAIIQPSLFEGWSTVVEDSKALNQNIIVSNIAVHKEQLNEKAFFFDPYNESSLVEQIKLVKQLNAKQFDFKYLELINKSAHNFITIMDTILGIKK